MDLLSSIRKEGSRGGVDFKWSDVTTSQHRENYLGHSLMAPVGRWQKNRDLSWYAKANSDGVLNKDGNPETAEEKRARERKEEIRKIKEAEEDALARALGLPVVDRAANGVGTGANGIDVSEVKRVIKETEAGDDSISEVGRGRGFGDYVGKTVPSGPPDLDYTPQKGGLLGPESSTPRRAKRPARAEDRSRSRSRSRDRRHRRQTHQERSRERDSGGRHRRQEREVDSKRNRSHSPHPRERQYRSERGERERSERERGARDRSRSPPTRRERSRSPTMKDSRRYRSRSRSSSPPRRERRDEREKDRDRRGSGAEYRAAQSRRSRPPDPRDRDRESRRVAGGGGQGGERWR